MVNEENRPKKYILYDSMIAFGNASQCAMTQNQIDCAYVRRKGRGRHKALQRKLRQLLGDENIHYLIVLKVSWVHRYVKTYEIIHFKYV